MLLNLFFDFLNRNFCFADDNESGAGTVTEEAEEAKTESEEENAEDSEEELVTIKGKQYKASELLGTDGIPRSKNLQIELERKNRELEESKELLKGIVRQPPQQQIDPQKQFDGIVNAVKAKYPNVDEETARMAVEISQGMVQAQAIARAPVDAEYFVDRAKSSVLRTPKEKDDDGLSDRSILEKWEDEVNDALNRMPIAWKANPLSANEAVANAINFVAGKHRRDVIKEAQEGLKRPEGVRPRDTSVISGGGSKAPKGAGNHGAGLTEAQKKDQHNMGNVSESEYHQLLKKAQERDKAAGRPPRQTLN